MLERKRPLRRKTGFGLSYKYGTILTTTLNKKGDLYKDICSKNESTQFFWGIGLTMSG
jgi:hypothetical protein